ncbi:hypothetical protein D3C87_1041340 [compost metagenome]
MLRRLFEYISDSKDRHEIIDLLDKNDLSSTMVFEHKIKQGLLNNQAAYDAVFREYRKFTSFPIFEIICRNGVYPRDVSFIERNKLFFRICQYNEIYDASKISDLSLCQEIENLFNVHEFRYGKIRDPMLRLRVRDKMLRFEVDSISNDTLSIRG